MRGQFIIIDHPKYKYELTADINYSIGRELIRADTEKPAKKLPPWKSNAPKRRRR